jgi:hypothetical protein
MPNYVKTVQRIKSRQRARELLRAGKTASRSGVVVLINKVRPTVMFAGDTKNSPTLTFERADEITMKTRIHRAAIAWAAKNRQTKVTVKPIKAGNPERQVEVYVLAYDENVDETSKELLGRLKKLDPDTRIYNVLHNKPDQESATVIYDMVYDADEATEQSFESAVTDEIIQVEGLDIQKFKYLTGPDEEDYEDPYAPDRLEER